MSRFYLKGLIATKLSVPDGSSPQTGYHNDMTPPLECLTTDIIPFAGWCRDKED